MERMPNLLVANSYQGVKGARFQIVSHEHPGPELVLVTKGRCTIESSEGRLTGSAGDLFICPARVPHAQQNHTTVSTLYCVYETTELLPDRPARVITVKHNRWIERWMTDLCDLFRAPVVDRAVMAQGILLALLRCVRGIEGCGKQSYPPGLARALAIIDSKPETVAHVKDLALRAAVSPSHLRLLFRKHLRRSPMHCVNSSRMGIAENLLSDPYLSIKEIALRCGFEDQNHFSRLFKQHCARSPSEFRSGLTAKKRPREMNHAALS